MNRLLEFDGLRKLQGLLLFMHVPSMTFQKDHLCWLRSSWCTKHQEHPGSHFLRTHETYVGPVVETEKARTIPLVKTGDPDTRLR